MSYIDSCIDCWLGFHFGLPLGLQRQQEWLLCHEHATQQVTQSLCVRTTAFFWSQLCKEENQLPLITGCHSRGHTTHSYGTWATTAFIIWFTKIKRACRSWLWDCLEGDACLWWEGSPVLQTCNGSGDLTVFKEAQAKIQYYEINIIQNTILADHLSTAF